MKLILIFMSITEKIEVNENEHKHISFRIYVYFTEYLLAVEIDEKVCKFIRINMSKEGFDADYGASRTQTIVSKFKDRPLKKN